MKSIGAGLFAGPHRASAAAPGSETLRHARAIVAGGRLGRVWLCRIPNAELTADVEFVLGSQPRPIFDIDPSAEETVLLGGGATLTLGGSGLNLYAESRRATRMTG
jgi:hypothetical protein